MLPSMGLLLPMGRARLVDRIGLVLDDSSDFASVQRSFVPERLTFMHHM